MTGNFVSRVSWRERFASALILAGVAGLGYWVFRTREPARETNAPSPYTLPEIPAPSTATRSSAATLAERLTPYGFARASSVESFTADSAYEKINGKVEFYLPLGLQSLDCIRYISVTNSEDTFEVFIYTLESNDAAFSACTLQRRPNSRALSVSPCAYISENLLAMQHGPLYVEMTASVAKDSLESAMERTARLLVEAYPISNSIPIEVGWFPTNDLISDSVTLTLHSGFGFEGFARLFTAAYAMGESRVEAFIVPAGNSAAALELFADYSAFLIDNGAVFENARSDIPGLRVYNVFGTYELVFVAGNTIGGVHQADDVRAAISLAERLFARLKEQLTE